MEPAQNSQRTIVVYEEVIPQGSGEDPISRFGYCITGQHGMIDCDLVTDPTVQLKRLLPTAHYERVMLS